MTLVSTLLGTGLLLGSGAATDSTTGDFAALPATAPAPIAAPQVDAPERPEGDTEGWDGQFLISASKTEGNTAFENYSVQLDATQVVDIHRYNIEALWSLSQDNSPAAANLRAARRAYGSFKYDQFFAEKTYFWLNAGAETDQPSDVMKDTLDLRWTIGGGLGHQFRDDEEVSILAEVGLAYFSEEYERGGEQDYLAARVAWDLDWNVSETTTLHHDGELYPSLEDTDDLYGRANTYADVKLSESMNARAQWVFTWDNTPSPGRNRKDNLYLLSVGWVF